MILLDTHALIWWASGDVQRFSPQALKTIEEERERSAQPGQPPGLLVSAISCWEVAMLVQRGRLALSIEVERWLALVAQARELGVPLLSADSRIRAHPHLQCLW